MITIKVETGIGTVTFNSLEAFIEYLKMLDKAFIEYRITVDMTKVR